MNVSSLRIRVEPAKATLEAGLPLVLEAEVFNGSRVVDEFAIDVVGIDSRFVKIDPGKVALFPSAVGNTLISIDVTSPYLMAAGPTIIGIRARSAIDPDASVVEEVPLDVLPVSQAILEIHPESIKRGNAGAFVVVARNIGNSPLEIVFRGSDPAGEISFTFDPETHVVPPGEEVWSIIDVRAPRPWLGSDVQRPITVTAVTPDPDAEPITATAVFVQRPRISGALVLIFVLLIAAALFLAAFLIANMITSNN